MGSELNRLQIFNQDTMSGFFPGSRTQVYQRLRLQLTGDTPERSDSFAWAILAWYREPESCSLIVEQSAQAEMSTKIEVPQNEQSRVLLWLVEPFHDEIHLRLQSELGAKDVALHACGTCANWVQDTTKTVDGLPTGLCQLTSAELQHLSNENRATLRSAGAIQKQSCLAMGCEHWTQNETPSARKGVFADKTNAEPSGIQLDKEYADKPNGLGNRQVRDRVWNHLSDWFRTRFVPRKGSTNHSQELSELLIAERSGVGAGTEQCFSCQGRIANLGALVVDSPEEDKQTYSVWRCRICYTYYLNEWTDRWERLDNLETEERYYRISAIEAIAVLSITESVAGGDHPHRRNERTVERDWFAQFLANREPLSHQIKHGR